jgi:cobalt/nickel transport protein
MSTSGIERADPEGERREMEGKEKTSWFDPFTRNVLIVGLALLFLIFASAYYMDIHHMKASGTDDLVNDLASRATQTEHHPLIELPGDAQLGAFSVGNLFAGLIVGYNWRKLFGDSAPAPEEKNGNRDEGE